MNAVAKRTALRAGLDRAEQPIVAVGAHDAMSAQVVESAGFDAVWVSGFGVSAMAHALPDVNLVTMSEALAAAVRMDRATSLPVVADCDNGFGGFNNMVRTVREYDAAGIAAVCIEDNLFPKRNSLLAGVRRELVPVDEQARRIRAATSQDGNGIVFIARVEALIAGHGVEAACDRADAYAESGADAILIHSRDRSLGEIEAFLERWQGLGSVPLVAVPTLFPDFSAEVLRAKGFNMIIFANQLMRASIAAMEATASTLATTRVLSSVEESIAPLKHVFDLVGTTRAIEAEDPETP